MKHNERVERQFWVGHGTIVLVSFMAKSAQQGVDLGLQFRHTVCDVALRWSNGDAAFKPGQTHACALVNAQAKSEVAVVLPLQQQLVELFKLGWSAVVLTPTEN